MTGHNYFHTGQTIAIREMWDGKIWTARACFVVKDTPEIMAFYAPYGIVSKMPHSLDGSSGSIKNRIQSEWILSDTGSPETRKLKLIAPGCRYSVIVFQDYKDGNLLGWYINLEEPLGKTAISYDSIDLILDAIIKPDLSGWYWDDEDELDEVVSAGIMSEETAEDLYKEGERAVNWIISGDSPFNSWESWQPDPSWGIPELPSGWDIV